MARDAIGKLAEADQLHAHAVKIKKRDPSGAASLEALASKKVRAAVKQLNTKPKRRGTGGGTVSRNGFGGPAVVPAPGAEQR